MTKETCSTISAYPFANSLLLIGTQIILLFLYFYLCVIDQQRNSNTWDPLSVKGLQADCPVA
jgi:hypothetical protein